MSFLVTESMEGQVIEVTVSGKLTKEFTTAVIKYFEHGDLEKAREWVRI